MASSDSELTRTQAPVNHSAATGDFTPGDARSNDQTLGAPTSGLEYPTAASVAGYDLITTLGRGGMGVVYKAKQQHLNRVVALKMTLGGAHAHPVERLRFLTEAEVIGGLVHPNIVPVYEFGTHEGQPYYTMEYLGGGSLSDKIKKGPLPSREAAEMIMKLAQALNLAHIKGVIHRDLKPGNVLFADDGTPKVVDFGLARQASSELTATQAVMGTPSYMAPEQALGKARDVGPATDVYALGAILYASLTGRPPFDGETAAETIERVKDSEPTSPRSIISGVPRDLETICLKCLQKEPNRRYNSAESLAEDLRRFMNGEPITARRVNVFERTLRWAIRKPTQAGLVAACFSLLIVGIIAGVTAWAATTIKRQNTELTNALTRAEVEHKAAVEAKEAEHTARQVAEKAKKQADEARTVAENATQSETEARKRLERLSYLRQVDLAHREWQTGEISRANSYLVNSTPEYRQWEWHYVNQLCHGEEKSFATKDGVTTILACPDGKHFATLNSKQTVLQVINYATGRVVFERLNESFIPSSSQIAFDKSGRLLAATNFQATVMVFDWAANKTEVSFNITDGPVTSLAFDPSNSQHLACALMKTIRIYNLKDLTQSAKLVPLPLRANQGKRPGPGPGPNQELGGGGKPPPPMGQDALSHNLAVAYSADGKYMHLLTDGQQGYLWRTADFTEVPLRPQVTRGRVVCAAFDPVSERLIRGFTNGQVESWTFTDNGPTAGGIFTLASNAIRSLVFSPTGHSVAVLSLDHSVRVYNSKFNYEPYLIRGHTDSLTDVAILPVPKVTGEMVSPARVDLVEPMQVVTGSTDGKLLGWSLPKDHEYQRVPDPVKQNFLPIVVATNADGSLIAFMSGVTSTVRVIRASDGRLVGTPIVLPMSGIMALTFSSDSKQLHVCIRERPGRWLANDTFGPSLTVSTVANLRTYNVDTGANLAEIPLGTGQPLSAKFSPDGRYIMLSKQFRTAMNRNQQDHFRYSFDVYDRTTGKAVISNDLQLYFSLAMQCDANNQSCSILTTEGYRVVYDLTTKDLPRKIPLPGIQQMSLTPADLYQFSPDGQMLLRYITATNHFYFWDLSTGVRRTWKSDHVGAVHHLAFNPDQSRFVSVGVDQAIKLWDIKTGEPVLTLRLKNTIRDVMFTNDGLRMYAVIPNQGILYYDGTPKTH